jgi:hypothetical protein
LDPLAVKYALVPQSQFRAVKPYFTGSTYIVMTCTIGLHNYKDS